MDIAQSAPQNALKNTFIRAAPISMVLLWSTAFIGTKLSLPFGEPLTLIFWRCATVAVFMLGFALLMRAPWPRDAKTIAITALVGIFIHVVFLSGSYMAITHGVSTGTMALVVGLQPILTGVVAGPLFGERVTKRQGIGLLLGFVGVALLVSHKFGGGTDAFYGSGYAFLSLFGMTAGTLLQKRYGAALDMRVGMAIQFTVAALIMGLLASSLETLEVNWTGTFILVHLWLVFGLSIGAIALTYLLIRAGAISKVASLFFLIPPLTAVIGYFLFGETLDVYGFLGMGVAVIGVALVMRAPG